MKTTTILFTLALGLASAGAFAQEGEKTKGGGEHRRPMPPLMTALDANGDGVIDAAEIANAPAALKKLDKNGDGKLTRDEIMPRPPQGQGQGQGEGRGAQGERKPKAE